MWDSLKPDWNRTLIMWLESKISASNVSQIELEKTESNPVKNRESNQVRNGKSDQVGNGDSNQVRHNESNQVRKYGHSGTVDSNYGDSVGYLKRKSAGSWCSGGMLAVIVTLMEFRDRRHRCIVV